MSCQAWRKSRTSSFEAEVMNSSEPVVVDFWAEWCGPCRTIAPTLDEIASDLQGKVKIARLNVDENPEVTGKYRIHSIPTLMMFKNGKSVASKVGVEPEVRIVPLDRRRGPIGEHRPTPLRPGGRRGRAFCDADGKADRRGEGARHLVVLRAAVHGRIRLAT